MEKLMKLTLGINFLHADTSACLFKDGELLVAAEEERFTRVKHTTSFPFNSIKFCLESNNIDISDIDIISINSNPLSSFTRKIYYLLKNPSSYKIAINSISNAEKKINLKKYINQIRGKQKFSGKIKYIDHHESHIASSLFFNNFKDCVNLSVDGFGDFASCAWGMSRNFNLKIDNKIYFPHSLGIFYQAMTQYLGFKNYGDEYKVMGLSSYGKPTYFKQLSSLINKTKYGFKLNLKYFIHHKQKILSIDKKQQAIYKNLYSEKLKDLLGEERYVDEKISSKHMDLAKSVQAVYEDVFFHILNLLYEKYKCNKLSLSGGCAMNSVANGKIIKNTKFEDIYISPNPGDAGGSVGSACVFINKEIQKKISVKNYAYMGSKFNNDKIREELDKNKIFEKYDVKYFKDNDLSNHVAKEISESKVVGWFKEQTEWGARALGNRSILADARNINIKDIINLKIKRRESFRPFAPAIMSDKINEWFEIDKEVPYMTEVYPIKKDKINIIPGVVHVDGTGRLQTVKKINNPKFYELINSFYKITNVPILLNTSFNENEPIVNNSYEAINCFERTNMDILVLENYVISR
ncbi:MAG: carbamoyltransferase [Rickettsiales bacterium]|nr:carbamoyltransferase [Rickettsiales bacterium]